MAARLHSNAGSAPSSREAQASGTVGGERWILRLGATLNFLSGFEGLREKKRGLVEATSMSYFTHRGRKDSWVHTEGLKGKNRAPFGNCWVREFIKQTERLGSVKASQRTSGPHHLSSLVNGEVVNFVWCLIACRATFVLGKQCSCYYKTLYPTVQIFSIWSVMDFLFCFDH